jgi:hypothetical protein
MIAKSLGSAGYNSQGSERKVYVTPVIPVTGSDIVDQNPRYTGGKYPQ